MLTFCAAFFYLSICKVIKFAFKRRECFFNKQRQNFNIFIKNSILWLSSEDYSREMDLSASLRFVFKNSFWSLES